MKLISYIPPKHVELFWNDLKPLCQRSVPYTYGRYKVEDMYDIVMSGSHQLWAAQIDGVFKGVVITNIMRYPQKTFLSMHFCGGFDLKEWKEPMLSKLREFAIEQKCDGIESTGRKGWERIFTKNGYKAKWITYELPLKEAVNG